MSTTPDELDAEIAQMAAKIAEASARLASKPLASGEDGRGGNGRFKPGNQIGKGRGNPLASEIGKRRAAMFAVITTEDFAAVCAKLVELAKRGNVEACKEILNRVLGRPVESDLIDKMEHLEEAVNAIIEGWQRDAGDRKYMKITTH